MKLKVKYIGFSLLLGATAWVPALATTYSIWSLSTKSPRNHTMARLINWLAI